MTTTDELRALLAAATPGPWMADSYSEDEEGCSILAVHEEIGLRTPTRGQVAWLSAMIGAAFESPGRCEANAALIVAAVNALPSLLSRLAEVEDALLGAIPIDAEMTLLLDTDSDEPATVRLVLGFSSSTTAGTRAMFHAEDEAGNTIPLRIDAARGKEGL